jgi:hypothetical protein
MEISDQTPADAAQGIWFDEWSSPASFDLLTNEHTTSVWQPAHLLGLRQAAARSPQSMHRAVDMQMTWDDEESTTRMWNLAHFASAGFFTPKPSLEDVVAKRFPAQVPTQRIGVAPPAARRRHATQPPPPPPARRTGPQAPVYAAQPAPRRAAPPPPPAARQSRASAHQPATATRTGARPAAHTTQRARALSSVPELAPTLSRARDFAYAPQVQPTNWLWTIAAAAGLFAAVLTGLALLPNGAPSVPVLTTELDALAGGPAGAVEPAGDTPQAAAAAVQPEVEPSAAEPSAAEPSAPEAAAVPTPAAKAASNKHRERADQPAAATPHAVSAADAARRPPVSAADAARRPPETPTAQARTAAPRTAAVHPNMEPRVEPNATESVGSKHEPGLLRINSRPWAQVFIDGKPRGATPQMGLPVNPGHHTVQLVNTPMGMSKTFPLDIRSGEIVTKVVNLIE